MKDKKQIYGVIANNAALYTAHFEIEKNGKNHTSGYIQGYSADLFQSDIPIVDFSSTDDIALILKSNRWFDKYHIQETNYNTYSAPRPLKDYLDYIKSLGIEIINYGV